MKVLLACLVDDYGDPARGVSFEYYNLYEPLLDVADDVVLFDFARIVRDEGRTTMNGRLLDVARAEQPDVVLIALFKEEFDADTIRELGHVSTTVAYFFDDNWRREFTARWANVFDFFTTPRLGTYRRHLAEGRSNVIFSPFGFNEARYRPSSGPPQYDVTFVGGLHPWRRFMIDRLSRAGIDVQPFGPFWPGGKISQDRMIEVFGTSKINLNLSNSRHWDARYLLSSWRAVRTTLRSPKDREQIKARHFEIPACGGFQLSYYCEDLEHHFGIGEEVEIYTDPDDMVDKVRFYLQHDDLRAEVARAGRERAAREHGMRGRLEALLASVTRRLRGEAPPQRPTSS